MSRLVPFAALLLSGQPAFANAFLSRAVPNGQVVKTGSLQTEQSGRELIVPPPKLAPGAYTVTRHATSVDTEGKYTFTVAQ